MKEETSKQVQHDPEVEKKHPQMDHMKEMNEEHDHHSHEMSHEMHQKEMNEDHSSHHSDHDAHMHHMDHGDMGHDMAFHAYGKFQTEILAFIGFGYPDHCSITNDGIRVAISIYFSRI